VDGLQTREKAALRDARDAHPDRLGARQRALSESLRLNRLWHRWALADLALWYGALLACAASGDLAATAAGVALSLPAFDAGHNRAARKPLRYIGSVAPLDRLARRLFRVPRSGESLPAFAAKWALSALLAAALYALLP
jgi:hypothetical protein